MVSQGRIQVFSIGEGGGGDDNNRPSNYTLNYFKLSYVFPKTWRFRKNEDWLASQGLCGSRISIIFWDPHISVCFYTYYIFWWAVLRGVAPLWIRPCCLLLLLRPIFINRNKICWSIEVLQNKIFLSLLINLGLVFLDNYRQKALATRIAYEGDNQEKYMTYWTFKNKMAAIVFRRRIGNSAVLINLLKRVLPYRRRSVSNILFYSTESATSRSEEFSLRYLEGKHEGAL